MAEVGAEVPGPRDEVAGLSIEADELGGQVDVQPAAVDGAVQGAGNADCGQQGGCHAV